MARIAVRVVIEVIAVAIGFTLVAAYVGVIAFVEAYHRHVDND